MPSTTSAAADARTSAGRGLASLAPAGHALLRIGSGVLFMEHGLQKLFGMFGGMGAPGASVPIASQMGLAGIIECFGGLLLALGLFTRPVALVMALEMLVAYFQAHFPKGGWPLENGGELPLLYMLVFLFFAANGAGPASLDSRRTR
jgi:putative oxidoreductase